MECFVSASGLAIKDLDTDEILTTHFDIWTCARERVGEIVLGPRRLASMTIREGDTITTITMTTSAQARTATAAAAVGRAALALRARVLTIART